MAELTNAEKLAEAETALHSLLTGKRVVTVGYDDRRLTFYPGDIDKLRQYIAELKALVDPTTYQRRPFRVIW
jgi:hypothetical protein